MTAPDERAALDERAAVVAWLRLISGALSKRGRISRWFGQLDAAILTLNAAANAIERAAHLPEKDRNDG